MGTASERCFTWVRYGLRKTSDPYLTLVIVKGKWHEGDSVFVTARHVSSHSELGYGSYHYGHGNIRGDGCQWRRHSRPIYLGCLFLDRFFIYFVMLGDGLHPVSGFPRWTVLSSIYSLVVPIGATAGVNACFLLS